jgi:voltage-gated potassium channel
MTTAKTRQKLRDIVLRAEHRVESLLILLSFLSIGLVVANEFLNPQMTPVWSLKWADLNITARTVIWLVFVSDFVVYSLLSRNRIEYMKTHLLELLICATWIPSSSGGGLLHHLIGNLYVGTILTVDVLQLIGTLAHGWRVVRWTARRFSAHPIIVTGSAAILLIASASALLNHFEPGTYPSFWDAAWFCLTTITTIGYGDYIPQTAIGRVITAFLIVGGMSLAGVFIGTVSESVRNRLLKSKGVHLGDTALREDLAANNKKQQEILEELRANKELQKQLLEELRRQRTGEHSEASPAEPAEEK